MNQTEADKLSLPAGKKEAIFYDSSLHGFGIRIREGGSRTYIVDLKIGTTKRRVTLGSTEALRLKQARDAAAEKLVAAKAGRDPAMEKALAKKQAADLFKPIAQQYVAFCQGKGLRQASVDRIKWSLLERWKCLHDLPVAAIDRRVIAARLRDLAEHNGPSAADKSRQVLSAFFSWAAREGLVEHNPVGNTNRYNSDSERDRVLADAELAQVWRALPDNDFGIVHKLLILTGQRREEIGGLRWSELDLQARMIRLPKERTKNKRPHDVPLSATAVRLLQDRVRFADRDCVFGEGANGLGAYGKWKHKLDARLVGVAPWVTHDLRRTCSTGMANLGVEPHVIEAVINHFSGHKRGVAGIYNRAQYDEQKREALSLWADHVMALVAPLRAAA